MERFRNTGSIRAKSKERKARIAASFFVAGAILAGTAPTEGKEPNVVTPIPNEQFHPVVLEDLTLEKEYIIRTSSPKPLSEEEERDLKINNELKEVIVKMEDHPDVFTEKYIKDVKMYYPIYKQIADKYGLDWYLLWIVHEKETGASSGEKGFLKDSYYKGAMQRDPNIWPESYVDKAFEGLEYLSNLPQRHKDDARDIAGAARMLSDNEKEYESRGDSKPEAVLKALLRYSAEGPARERFDLYKEVNNIFS